MRNRPVQRFPGADSDAVLYPQRHEAPARPSRLPSWPPHPEVPAMPALTSRGALITFAALFGLTVFVCAWSFQPLPDFLLLSAVLVAIWMLLWLTLTIALGHQKHTWLPYLGARPQQRGRDSRVTALRAILSEGRAQPVIAQIVDARLARRGLSRRNPAHGDDLRSLLGPELLAYLDAEEAFLSAAEFDHFLQRIERL